MTYTTKRLELHQQIRELQKPSSDVESINLNSLTEEELQLFVDRLKKLGMKKKQSRNHFITMSDKEFSDLVKEKK